MLPFYLFLIPLALSFYEPKRSKNISAKNSMSVLQNKNLRRLLIYSAIIVTAIDISYYLYQPYFKLSGLDIVYFGLVFAAFNLIQALSAKYSHLIEKKLGRNFSLILLFVLTGLCYILMGKIIIVFSFIFAFLFQLVGGFSQVVISDYIHKETTSNIRATVLSVRSFLSHIFYALSAPIVGYAVDLYTLPQALIIIGIVVIISGCVCIYPLLRKTS